MSRIIPWMVHESVQIPLCSTLTRVEQLKELNTKCKWMVNCSEAVNSKLFLAALGDELPETKRFIDRQEIVEDNNKILLCLTASGESDDLSKWTRSLALAIVFNW